MTNVNERADFDSPWKEILEAYFPQAMQFFFPETAALIDWERPYQFLNKEFQQIACEAEQGKRYADQLVKVWQIQGQELWLLIHVEIQAQKEDNFSKRMFTYNFRIFDRFDQPAISLAILCDTNREWRPSNYSYNYPDTRLDFEFGSVKLLDYEDSWEELENSNNPFATVVMAHLKTQQTRSSPAERKIWKFRLIRRLYDIGLQEQDIRNLYRFIDWVMILPKALENQFWDEFKQFEQERTMRYVTTGERIGYERGREEGKQEGRQEGEQAIILKLLKRRVGELSPEIQQRIQSLSGNQLETLGEALLDFTSMSDLLNWLESN
ncbi:Rpn family recombination-promoting nuclease/putative transposase [Anabaena sp. CCY 0017]|uniref:Rpn family recombination-promoting nuclease/putative transposase n=1 Tax=Anabaena sp. CCY 0017 TaxID=3103866 RepID=UPI0039C66A52